MRTGIPVPFLRAAKTLITARTCEENIIMEENTEKPEQDDPKPLTDEEYAEFLKKEKRKGGIISSIIDFILGFFH